MSPNLIFNLIMKVELEFHLEFLDVNSHQQKRKLDSENIFSYSS